MQVHSDWSSLGTGIFFRKFQLYQMEWTQDVNLCYFDRIEACRFGGPIALIKYSIQSLDSPSSAKFNKPVIVIYTSSGQRIGLGKSKALDVICVGWTHDQSFMVVQADGSVLIYDVYGVLRSEYILNFNNIEVGTVIDCRIFTPNHRSTAIVMMARKTPLSSSKFYLFSNVPTKDVAKYKSPSVSVLPDVPSNEIINCWQIMSRSTADPINDINDDINSDIPANQLLQMNLIVATNQSLYIIECRDKSNNRVAVPISLNSQPSLPIRDVQMMCVSFDSSRITLYIGSERKVVFMSLCTEDVTKYIGINLKEIELSATSNKSPDEFFWCGLEAVCVLWKPNLLQMIGLGTYTIEYRIESSATIVNEMDCIRVIGNQLHEMVSQVAPVCVNIFRVATATSAANLVVAYKKFKEHSLLAYDAISEIKYLSEMKLAILQCIQAAGLEFGRDEQKLLLLAAHFGMQNDPGSVTDEYTQMCRKLRLLNCLRDSPISMPVTYCQFEYLTLEKYLDRIMALGYHSQALHMVKWMRTMDSSGKAKVLANWACSLICKTNLEDDYVASKIREKFGQCPPVPYADIAGRAIDENRTRLAIVLLEAESHSSKQIPLLLKLKQYDQVFKLANQCCDSNLIYMVIFWIQEYLKEENKFISSLRNYKNAYALYRKYLSAADLHKLIIINHNDKNYQEEAKCYILNSQLQDSDIKRLNQVDKAVEAIQCTDDEFAKKMFDKRRRLLLLQVELKKSVAPPPFKPQEIHEERDMHKFYGSAPSSSDSHSWNKSNGWINLSLSHTVINLLALGETTRARKLKEEFKVAKDKFEYMELIASKRPLPALPAAT